MKTPKSIFFLCLISCVLCLKTNAQIVYTDVNPDITVNRNTLGTSSYILDVNNDGINDFRFNATVFHASCIASFTACKINVETLNNNKVAIEDTISNSLHNPPLPLVFNQIIKYQYWDSTNTGVFGKLCILKSDFPCDLGLWGSGIDSYLGIKFIFSNNTYYGWVKLHVSLSSAQDTASFTIKDYAYNSLPNQPILAGETSCTTPTVNLTASGPLSFCNGDSVTLIANGTGYQYQWKKNNVNISGATKQTYVAKTAGVYKCKVTNSCGSKTSGTRTVTVPCRMSNENLVETLEHLSVYPNPATNSITVKFPSDEAGEISIVNLFGQSIYSEKINAEQTNIDVSRLSEGMYVVRWSSGENNETKTFSVIK